METLLNMIQATHEAATEAACRGFMDIHEDWARLFHKLCDGYQLVTGSDIRDDIAL